MKSFIRNLQYCLILAIFAALTPYIAHTQTTPQVKVLNGFSVENPQFTLRSYFDNLEDDNYHPEIAARTMNFSGMKGKKYNSAYLAQKLHRILVAKGIIVKLSSIPIDANYIDSTSMQQQFELSGELPEIYLQKYGKKWLFSSETVTQIDRIYDKVIPFEIYQYVDKLPKIFKNKFLGMAYWQYAALIMLFVAVYFLVVLMKFVFTFILKKIFNHLKTKDIDGSHIVPVGKLLARLVGVLLLIALIPILEIPIKVNLFIALILKATIPFILMFIFFRFVNIMVVILQKVAKNSNNSLDDHIIPFVGKALKCVIAILLVFYILDILNINITPLLAGVSIGGLAFALAAQDTVKNLFGSLTIFGDQPFSVKDWIVLASGEEGIVEEIGLRSTKIRTFEDSVISVPNGTIADAVINNYGRRRVFRYNPVLGIVYGTQLEKIKAFMDGIKEIVNNYPLSKKDKIEVSFYNFGSSSIDIRLSVYFEVSTFAEMLQAREDINLQIFKLAEDLSVGFAFPSQSVYMEEMTPPAKESTKEIASRMKGFSEYLKSLNKEQNGDKA